MSFLSFRTLNSTAPWDTPPAELTPDAEPLFTRHVIERVLDEAGRRHFEPMREAVVLDQRRGAGSPGHPAP
ncbi:hypothetical protein DBR42_10760 [Pelomonas sp. HMWF004]|nr:hypothetical protein DBR42_10760 [Pelomonas sp. HMWF004]